MKKYIPFVVFILIVILSSCDGRDKATRTIQEDLIEKEVLDTFTEIIKYLPEEYTEVVTDTILSNGFQVRIKTSSDMNHSILNEVDENTIKYKYYYRDYIGQLDIYYNNTPVFSNQINKSTFKTIAPNFKWEDAIMGQIALDQENSTKKEVYLDVFYCLVESDICKDFKLIIDQSGTLKVEEIKTPELP